MVGTQRRLALSQEVDGVLVHDVAMHDPVEARQNAGLHLGIPPGVDRAPPVELVCQIGDRLEFLIPEGLVLAERAVG